jgi:hypothetical protein
MLKAFLRHFTIIAKEVIYELLLLSHNPYRRVDLSL